MGFGFLRDLKIYEKCLSITSEAPRHWWCEDEISWEIQFIGHVVATMKISVQCIGGLKRHFIINYLIN
jgi:hypothetical protein